MSSCPSCGTDAEVGAPVCPSCKRLLPIDRREDHFTLLGLPRVFAVDAADLELRFRDRSRQVHPDRFAKAEPRERRLALERATRLNDAHRVLRDWRQRAAYLLKLASHDPFADGSAVHDAGFLEEQLELREALAVARMEGDAPRLGQLAEDASRRLLQLEQELRRLFDDERWYSDHAREIAQRLARARYYDNLAAEAARAAAPAPTPTQR